MNSVFLVFAVVAAFTADAAFLPFNRVLGNGFYGSNFLANSGISIVPGAAVSLAPISAIKIVPNQAPPPRVPAPSQGLPAPTDFDVFSPAPQVRCVCTARNSYGEIGYVKPPFSTYRNFGS